MTSSQTPGAQDVHIMGGTVTTGAGTQAVNIITGTVTQIGTVLGIGGTVQVSGASAGTVVEINKGSITTGTLGLVSRIGNIGTIESGTVTTTLALNTGTITTIVAGTQNTLGTVGVINNGTLAQVTTVSNLTNGTTRISVGTVGGAVASGAAASGNPNIIAGTDSGGSVYSMLVDTAGNPQVDVVTIPQISVGTIPQVSVGTLPTLNLTTGTITTGSLANIAQVHNAGTLAVGTNNIGDVDIATGTVTLVSTLTTLSNLTNGSVNILTGTLQSSGTTTGVGVVSNLTNGSVNILTGTVTSVTNLAGGTVQINDTPIQTPLDFGTLGTAGGSFFATISAASGAGTKHYISGLQIVVQSGTPDVRILAGSAIQGTGFLAGGALVPSAGIVREFDPPRVTGTNSEIIYHFVSAGTALISVNYWKGA